MTNGEYFGEVSFMYKCRRTSTIKAKLYSTLGCIDHTQMTSLLHEYPLFKQHMEHDIVNIYDDDIKLFLVSTLRKIDYLQRVSNEVIVNLAYLCCADIKEKGYVLHDMDQPELEQVNDELIIIFDGSIELYLMMDAGTDLVIETLPAGSIINSHNMLSRRKHSVNARFASKSTFYYLKYSKLVEVALRYPSFRKDLLREKGRSEALKSRDQNPIDFIRGSQTYFDLKDKPLDAEKSQRIFNALFAFKNAVIYYLHRNRRDRKVQNLRKILEEFITKKNKQKEMQRVKKRELEALPLE